MGYGYYPRYVSVAEKRARAEKKIKQLRKKNPDIRPVILAGQALATTWWGKAWNSNLERYADYTNRIGRGRSYVRHMAVLDLKISPGRVDALVQGSRGAPYKVRITIAGIKKKNWQAITEKCRQELSSLPELLAGKFPRKLQDVFMIQGRGLFPTPSEISFDCSCPDWASMCKHVAASLYGVGARLDEDPALFFTLRKADMEDLVDEAVKERTEAIFVQKSVSSGRRIADEKLSDLFGLDIDIDVPVPAGPKKPKKRKQKKGKKAVEKTNAPPTGRKNAGRKKKKKTSRAQKRATAATELPAGYGSAADLVLGCIEEGGEEGLSVAELSDITGIPAKRLYPILQRLKKQRKICRLSRGVYGPGS